MASAPTKMARVIRGVAYRLKPQVSAPMGLQVGPRCTVSGPGKVILEGQVRLLGHNRIFVDDPDALVTIGQNTFLNRRAEINCRQRVAIGNDCVISWDVQISDTDYHNIDGGPADAPVVIGSHVWIGQRALILKGVTIGDGAVIAAGAVVNRAVPARTVVAGIPARVVRADVVWT